MQRVVLTLLALFLAVAPARADTLHVLAAGSLTDAFSDLLRRFPAGTDTVAPPEFGPSGLLRQKIETGTEADLFASADMEQARRLTLGHPERTVINFTRNQLCAVARISVGMTSANMLDKLLDPAVRVATSTPGADPGGDYAWAVFARAETVHPGAKAALEAKALKLVGGGDKTPLLVPGKPPVPGVFLANKADVMLGYCSGSAAVLRAVPDLVSVPLPPDLTVGPAYGMVLLNARPLTARFAVFVMSEAGQAVLHAYGFDAVALADQAPEPSGLLVQRAGQASQIWAVDRIAALPPITQRIAIEHGEQSWTGPLLWDVLVAAHAIDPAKPVEQARAVVRVTGADGWFATFAMAELSPQFAGKPIELATKMNDKPIPASGLRLIVPGEKRGARSVRDVVRIDIE